MKVIEILRLSEMGYSQSKIKDSVKCARSTVGEVLKRCRRVGLTYEQAQKMNPEEIKTLLYPAAVNRYLKEEPDYEYVYNELEKHPNLNLYFLWSEYKESNPGGLGYSQFCERFNRWKAQTGKNLVMHQERVPGKEMFVDWMGETPELVTDSESGNPLKAHLFVAVLGYSGYPYVEAFPNEKQENWILGHVHAFEYYGAVPLILVPDNCKTSVTRPEYYDPQINPVYWELAKHYEVAVIPARPKEPRDKALVEESIGWLETWLLGRLRNRCFFSFSELNIAIRAELSTLSEQPYQKRSGSRKSVFFEVDLPAMRPLPTTRFEVAKLVTRKVPDNYHVEFDGFYYSVPYTYYKQQVTIRATASTVEIFNTNLERIASHVRQYAGNTYVTNSDHMPEHHRAYWDFTQWDGDRYRSWAKQTGENTFFIIDSMLNSYTIEEQAYRACMGFIRICEKYGAERLEKACAKARKMDSLSLTTVKNILKNKQEQVVNDPSETRQMSLPLHENIRGSGYYQ